MTLDKWIDIKYLVETKFSVEEQGQYFSEEYGGTETEYIVFEGAIGRVKLEFCSKPKVIDKQVNYSNRIGSDVNIEYNYSETEKNYQLSAYRWSDDEDSWIPLSAEISNLF